MRQVASLLQEAKEQLLPHGSGASKKVKGKRKEPLQVGSAEASKGAAGVGKGGSGPQDEEGAAGLEQTQGHEHLRQATTPGKKAKRKRKDHAE